jgi:peroxiredoxin
MAFTLQIGQSAPDFDLPGVDGKRYSLASFQQKLLVIVFTCNHCPYVIGSEDRMLKFAADFMPRGMGMVGINSNETVGHPQDSFENMVQRARERGFTWPYLRDEDQTVALAYGALRTPHYYVFDAARRLGYTGRMDDNPRQANLARTHELRDAVEAMLEGRRPPVELTNPIGCNVKWKEKERHWMPPEACDLV